MPIPLLYLTDTKNHACSEQLVKRSNALSCALKSKYEYHLPARLLAGGRNPDVGNLGPGIHMEII
jgi:hypothetical protein